MRRTLSLACLTLCAAAVGCTSFSPQNGDAGNGTGSSSGTGTGAAGPGQTGSGGGGTVAGTLGMVVVDTQEAFVSSSSTPDMEGIIERTRGAFELAGREGVPFFLTFEASQQGDHSLHAPLVSSLPEHAQKFTKTTFAATGLPGFVQAMDDADLSHLAVLGAETDVCVLQTVLGLRALGYDVLLVEDAVFTEETNTSPAIARMRQAGVHIVEAASVAGYVSNPNMLPAPSHADVRITRPLEIGVVLHGFTDAAVTASVDPLATEKSARLRELLMVSEWFELPVYAADVSVGLPTAFQSYYDGALRPLAQIEADGDVTQLVFAGTDDDLAGELGAWMDTHVVFVMQDAVLAASEPAGLEPLFAAGLVPTTYKSFYYDMTQSVDESEWPSQAWVDRIDPYYWLTSAPEDLPPLPASP